MPRRSRLPCQATVWFRRGYRVTMCMVAAEHVRDGRACCYAHSTACEVEWYSDRVHTALARLRQLKKELARRRAAEQLSREHYVDRVLLYPPEW